MIRRPWLLLSAAVTVTIPGILAILAILGHEHMAGETAGLAAMSTGDTSLTGPPLAASAKTHAVMGSPLAKARSAAGMSVTVDGIAMGGLRALGLRLLVRAARAGEATSYEGTELTSQDEVGGEVTTISTVWHSGGGPTRLGSPGANADVVGSPAGVFGLTEALVKLLGEHYVAVYQGTAQAVGRPASLVEVYRFDGTLAARFWLDRQTLVPLRRELFDVSDHLVRQDAFAQVRFGGLKEQPAAAAASAAAVAAPAWVTAASPEKLLASLAGQGWRLPGTLPGDLPLYAAASSGAGTGKVTDLEYSDGLWVVSLFVQRGTLASDMAGWRPAIMGGHQVYVSGRSVTWSWHGLVCTMIADAPPRAVAQAVAALPGSAPAGALDRLRRGLDRLAHLVDPFR